jgi:two-component system nitrate/nitrite response regulator NarL
MLPPDAAAGLGGYKWYCEIITRQQATIMIKIFLADDQPSIRKGLQMQMALERDFLVVGETGDSLSTVQHIAELEPDVVILDIDMPGRNGFEILQALRCQELEVPVVILSMQADPVSRQRAFELGAADFVEKQAGGTELFTTIRRVAGRSRPPGSRR